MDCNLQDNADSDSQGDDNALDLFVEDFMDSNYSKGQFDGRWPVGLARTPSFSMMGNENHWDLGERPDTESYNFLLDENVVDLMNDMVDEVSTDLEISRDQARRVLKMFQWNESRVRKIRSDPNSRNEFQTAGFGFVSTSSNSMSSGSSDDTDDAFEIVVKCAVCGVNDDVDSFERLECEHGLCGVCLKEHVIQAVSSMERSNEEIQCAANDCDAAIPHSLILSSMESDQYLNKKFMAFQIESFIEDYALISRCPNPGCKTIVQASQTGWQQIRCACGTKYCFSCSKPWHSAVPCELLEAWQQNQEESGSHSKIVARVELEIQLIRRDIINLMDACKESEWYANFEVLIRARKVLLSSFLIAKSIKDETEEVGEESKTFVEQLQKNLETVTQEMSIELTKRRSFHDIWEIHERIEMRLSELITFLESKLAWKSGIY